ncbi:Polygalacturonase [Pseudozyma hubeiensis]|nr:Polygalacturonase [Pseudozyma hubeiensis]
MTRSYLALLLLALGVSDSLAASCSFTDAASAKSGKGSCSTITLSNIKVPAGQTLDLTGLNSGTKVIFSGTTTFGYSAWEGPLISVSGSNIDVSGASGSLIDGGGAQWWDGKGSNGGKSKPKFFYAHGLKNSNIRYLNVKNTPVQGFSINGCTNLNVDHVTIDNSAGDTNNLGHNTDAFDVGSSNGVFITNANVRNQDDCLAINSGSNILFSGGYCAGGHGLSIGSVGGRSDNTVDGVRIVDSQVVNSDNAIRIKTVSGATGTVNNVTYSNIRLSGIAKYGIDIQQDYLNGGPTGMPSNGVKISNVDIKGVTGSVSSGATQVYILCGSGSCSNWQWSGVSISGGSRSTKCTNVPSPASC